MSPRKRWLLPLLLLWSRAAVAAPDGQPQGAASQPASQPADQPSSAPHGQRATGWVRGILFDADDRPLAGVPVAVGRARGVTSGDGGFALRLPAATALQLQLRLQLGGQPVAVGPFAVIAGQTTELLVTLRRENGAPRLQVEAPSRAAARRGRVSRAPRRTVRGRVQRKDNGRPVAGARVLVRGLDSEAVSDGQGRFQLALPAGRRVLTVVHPRFGTARVPLQVGPALAEPLLVQLVPADVAMDDFTVLAPRIVGSTANLLQARQNAAAVTDLIGAEQMSRSGDSDAAAAMGRVTGITVVGGKYVYVRGLGERYSATLLNGSTLPSPEPEKRVVPLDMFPAGVLDSIVVQKTYSPDLPGEFGGGMVRLRTRGFPAKRVAKISLSSTINEVSVGRSALSSAGSSLDFLTLGGGARELPGAVANASARTKIDEKNAFSDVGYSAEELEQLGQAMRNNWGVGRHRLWPDIGINATLGQAYGGGRRKGGFLASLSYDKKWRRRLRPELLPEVRRGASGLEVTNRYRAEESEHTVDLAAVLSGGLDLGGGRHKLRLTSLAVRSMSDETRQVEGFNADAMTQMRQSRLRYIERMLLYNQLTGEHALARDAKRLSLSWRYAFSMATRDEPDRREYRYDQEQGELYLLSNRPDGNQRLFAELSDLNHDAGADLTWRFRQWAGKRAKLKAGLAATLSDRTSSTRRYRFASAGPLASDPDLIRLPPEQLFVPQTIGSDGFRLQENTRETDNYSGSSRLLAAYAMVQLPLWRALSLSGGVRLERSSQRVETFQLFDPNAVPIVGGPTTLDALPAATLSYRLTPAHVLRLAYGRVVNRPQTRELSPAPYDDVAKGTQYRGNPELSRALIDNVDLRWEWYPRRGESISLALFYKRFQDPIELVAQPSAQVTLAPQNAAGARNLGLELELRKRLDVIHPWLRDLSLGGNGALIQSRVELRDAGVATESQRPLQGQSPWVFNAFLSYDNADSGTNGRLLYNVFGPRIASVGSAGRPDVYEQPRHRLDLVLSQRLSSHLSLSLKAQNLLDQRVRLTQDVLTVDGYRPGRQYSLSLGGHF